MSDLLDLLDGWSDKPEWVPIYTIYGDLASMVRGEPCRDCGGHGGYNQGGAAPGRGMFRVCDDCAQIDGCHLLDHELLIGPHRRYNLNLAARCSCGWDISMNHHDDAGDWVPWTPDELVDILADHIRPKHYSHWGTYPHELADCDRLHKARDTRRARYLAQHPRSEVAA